jgi:hypothetical protein
MLKFRKRPQIRSRSAAKLLSKDEARRIAVNIAMLALETAQ